jgi:hypothetical protein
MYVVPRDREVRGVQFRKFEIASRETPFATMFHFGKLGSCTINR